MARASRTRGRRSSAVRRSPRRVPPTAGSGCSSTAASTSRGAATVTGTVPRAASARRPGRAVRRRPSSATWRACRCTGRACRKRRSGSAWRSGSRAPIADRAARRRARGRPRRVRDRSRRLLDRGAAGRAEASVVRARRDRPRHGRDRRQRGRARARRHPCPGSAGFCQVTLDREMILALGDRFVLRPQNGTRIGGRRGRASVRGTAREHRAQRDGASRAAAFFRSARARAGVPSVAAGLASPVAYAARALGCTVEDVRRAAGGIPRSARAAGQSRPTPTRAARALGEARGKRRGTSSDASTARTPEQTGIDAEALRSGLRVPSRRACSTRSSPPDDGARDRPRRRPAAAAAASADVRRRPFHRRRGSRSHARLLPAIPSPHPPRARRRWLRLAPISASSPGRPASRSNSVAEIVEVVRTGDAVRISDDVAFGHDAYAEPEQIVEFLAKKPEITMGEVPHASSARAASTPSPSSTSTPTASPSASATPAASNPDAARRSSSTCRGHARARPPTATTSCTRGRSRAPSENERGEWDPRLRRGARGAWPRLNQCPPCGSYRHGAGARPESAPRRVSAINRSILQVRRLLQLVVVRLRLVPIASLRSVARICSTWSNGRWSPPRRSSKLDDVVAVRRLDDLADLAGRLGRERRDLELETMRPRPKPRSPPAPAPTRCRPGSARELRRTGRACFSCA